MGRVVVPAGGGGGGEEEEGEGGEGEEAEEAEEVVVVVGVHGAEGGEGEGEEQEWGGVVLGTRLKRWGWCRVLLCELRTIIAKGSQQKSRGVPGSRIVRGPGWKEDKVISATGAPREVYKSDVSKGWQRPP